MSSPFRYFNSSPEVIRLVVMMYVRYPLSLRNVEDLLAERGIDISHETVRFWWNRFGRDVRRRDPGAKVDAVFGKDFGYLPRRQTVQPIVDRWHARLRYIHERA